MMIEIRAFRSEDLALLHAWLNDPEIMAWWDGEDVSYPAVVARYGTESYGSRRPNIEQWIAQLITPSAKAGARTAARSDHRNEPSPVNRSPMNRRVGWLQSVVVGDDPIEWALLGPHGVAATAVGIDYLIGGPRGQGLGTAMIDTFCSVIVPQRYPEATQIYAVPHRDNAASLRALQHAGFVHHDTIHLGSDTGCLMIRPADRQIPRTLLA